MSGGKCVLCNFLSDHYTDCIFIRGAWIMAFLASVGHGVYIIISYLNTVYFLNITTGTVYRVFQGWRN